MKAEQLSLFSEFGGGSHNSSSALHLGGLSSTLKASMQRALASAAPHLSRAQLVDRMNEIAKYHGVKITTGRTKLLTTNILDKWLAPNDTDDMPPILAVEVFMMAIGSFAPLEAFAEFNGCKVMGPDEVAFYEYGKAKFESKERAKELRMLENKLSTSKLGRR